MVNPVRQTNEGIPLYDEAGFEGMRKAGQLAAKTLDMITPHVQPGISTEELNTLCHDFITKNGAIPAPLNYKGFPKSVCTSINHVVCHGIPGEKKLAEGDIINIDVTVILDGWYGDTSRMFTVGKKVSIKARKLIDVTYECMMAGIAIVRPGIQVREIGKAIEEVAAQHKYGVVKDFCGHGLGRVFHCAPSILHYDDPIATTVLEPGMFFTIEPMINIGSWETKMLNDGWTAVTKDKSLSAQFEHSLGVTEDGYEIFTTSPKGWLNPPYE